MKRNKRLSEKKNYVGYVAGIALIAIIIAVVVFSGNNDAPEEIVLDDVVNVQETFEEPVIEEVEEVEIVKEETVPIPEKKIGEKGLCEDYFFEQGDSLDILKHTIRVDRIGDNALRLNVDGENYVMSDDDSIFAGDGIRLATAQDSILYFGSDDPSNAVMIRVGCRYDVDPNEKYVQDRGQDLCQEIYESCKESFDIE